MTEHLSRIVPTENAGDLLRSPEFSHSKNHSILACRLCGTKLDSDTVQHKPLRPGPQAELSTEPQNSTETQKQIHIIIPARSAAIAFIIALVCSIVYLPALISIMLGLVLLWKLCFVPGCTSSPQPQLRRSEVRPDECRKPPSPSRRIRIADLLSEEEPNPFRRIRIEDLLSKDETNEIRHG